MKKRKRRAARFAQTLPSLAASTATNADLISIITPGFTSWTRIPYYSRKMFSSKPER